MAAASAIPAIALNVPVRIMFVFITRTLPQLVESFSRDPATPVAILRETKVNSVGVTPTTRVFFDEVCREELRERGQERLNGNVERKIVEFLTRWGLEAHFVRRARTRDEQIPGMDLPRNPCPAHVPFLEVRHARRLQEM